MSRFLGKFAFVHRRLWGEDGMYRAALLFGPAPLIGCLLAGAVWAGVAMLATSGQRPPAWATPEAPPVWGSGGQPQAIAPPRPLPPMGPGGLPAGYEPGAQGTIHPIVVSPALDVDLKATALSGFALEGPPGMDMARLIAVGPKGSLYAGVGSGLLAVRTAGVYAITARLERPAGPAANCLTRLGFAGRRIVSNLEVDVVADVAKQYEAARFDLQPGLYPLDWAFVCFRGREVIGSGRMVVLVSHPGESTLLPARSDDVVRPARGSP